MDDNDMKVKEMKFDSFLNKTIIYSGKCCYKKDILRKKTEYNIIDDERFSEYLKKYIKYHDKTFNSKDRDDFLQQCDNETLSNAFKQLSHKELTVILGLFVDDLTHEDLSKILDIHYFSVSRIKSRALLKIKNYFLGGDNNA